jgi:hypothetical protein
MKQVRKSDMAKPKVILQLYPMFPADGEEGRKAKRPLDNDREIYNEIMHEWDEVVVEADQMSVWGLGTIEHHLHSEDYEVGPNPGLLNARWSTMVKNVNVGALGYVTLILHWAQVPKEVIMEELQLFMHKVLPEFEIPDFEPMPAVATE